MPKFAANLSWLFTELSFMDRFNAAAEAGFEAVEFLFPYEFGVEDIAKQLQTNNLKLALFNMPPGNWDKGDRGIAILPGSQDAFEQALVTALDYAEVLECQTLHCMAGLIPDDADLFQLENTYINNLKLACEAAGEIGCTIVIEPINSFDMPGYYLNYTEQAATIVEKVDAENLKIQFDIYHAQRMAGELAETFRTYKSSIGHIQIADNPGRHEPGTGEINFRYLFDLLDKEGYEGYIGCEYKPYGKTEEGLNWFIQTNAQPEH